MQQAAILITAVTAGILQGVTGFGAGIVLMLVLPYLFPLSESAGISGMICLVLNFAMLLRYRRHIRFKLVIFPCILFLCASSAAIFLAPYVPQTVMSRIFGLFLILLGAYYLFLNPKPRPIPLPLGILFILISGVCDGLFSIGGPLMVLYFLSQTTTREEYLGTIQCFFFLNGVYNTTLRLWRGVIGPEHFVFFLFGAAGMLLGVGLAFLIGKKLSDGVLRRVTYMVIVLSGILQLI